MACGMTIVSKMTYRGNPEEFSNQYWFTGATPADAAAWLALFNALAAQHKTVLPATTTIVRAYGYDSDADGAVAVWSRDLTASPNTPIAGTLTIGTGVQAPGDDAVWVRWGTSRTNTGSARRIYLRKYFHPAYQESTGGGAVLAAQQTALLALGAKLRDGTFLDARTLTARGHTDTLVGHSASQWITTRTLKRRGKRPGS